MNDILEIVSRLGPAATPRAIARELGRPPASVRVSLCRLVRQGVLVRLEDGTYRVARDSEEDDFTWLTEENEPVNALSGFRTTVGVNADVSGGRGEDRPEERTDPLPSPPVDNAVNANVLMPPANAVLTPDAGVSPFAAFATGYEDAAGEEPDDRLVLARVRQFLTERGISPFAEAVNEELAAELYLLGYEAAGDRQDPDIERWQSEAEYWRQKADQLEAELAAARERNKELLRKLEKVQAEDRQFRQWAVDLYLRYSDLLDGNLQLQHLTDLVRRGLQRELAATARRLGIG